MTLGRSLAFAVIALLAWGYWWLAISGYYSYRYRLTIEVQTPDGIKSGSSVLEVFGTVHTWGWGEVTGVRGGLRGDAVFIDLGQGRNLVALLAGGPAAQDERRIHSIPVIALDLDKLPWEQQMTALRGALTGRRAEVPREMLPTLVTFSDVADAKTARIVPPDGFGAAFGPGFKLNRALIEITKDNVTRGIEREIPWVGQPDAELIFERRLRASENGIGSAMLPGRNLRRNF